MSRDLKGVWKMSDEVQQKVDAYKPQIMTNDQWATWGESIVESLVATKPTATGSARRVLSIMASFAVSLDGWGLDAPIQPHFTLPNLERHIAGLKTAGTRRTARRDLLATGRIVNPKTEWPMQVEPVPRSDRAEPYSEEEIESFVRAAVEYPGDRQRRLLQVCLALGLAAGLDGRSVPEIAPADISSSNGVVTVQLRSGVVVPLPGIFGEWLTAWANTTAPGQPIVGKQLINQLVSTLESDTGQQLRLARLRTTWIVALLECRLPIQDILLVTGLKTPSSLERYVAFASPVSVSEASQLLAGLGLDLTGPG